MIFYNFTPCFEHFNIKLTNVSAFCTMSLLYVLLQLILRKLLVATPPKTCHTPRAETPPSLIQPLAGLLPWLLCIIVVTRRQETGASRPPEAQIEKCWPAALLPWLLCIIVVTRRQETGTSRPAEGQNWKLLVCSSAALAHLRPEMEKCWLCWPFAAPDQRPTTTHQGPRTCDQRLEIRGPGPGTRGLGPRTWDQGAGGQKWTGLAPAGSPKLSKFMAFYMFTPCFIFL